MCATCGCSVSAVSAVSAGHSHDHPHGSPHAHDHREGTRTLTLEQRVLAKNDALAERNRGWLAARGVRAVNVMSSPGSGKTTLLERTVSALAGRLPVAVVEGDQETSADADRIARAGAPVVQINTGSGCHLDAAMFESALRSLDPHEGIVIVENVGNLVCPALFDLGEGGRVVIMSVTEGADKPLKYPHMFRTADLVVLNKLDLLPYVEFDVEGFERDVALVNPGARTVQLSATRGDGIEAWYDWLDRPGG
ncbi:MAG: hydrogenase nickel incorporation protein HypB [Pseudonocardiales bacterium]|nr:hydrogenase nickel incorporation protein HypB [Pseudonocardiales bacterium]